MQFIKGHKLLKIDSFSAALKSNVQLTGNAPVAVDFSRQGMRPHLYWRCGDFSRNLLEIGIDETTRNIISIVVVLVERIEKEPCSFHGEYIVGSPCVVLTDWPHGRYKDEAIEFRLNIGGNVMSILFAEKTTASTAYVSGDVSFGVGAMGDLVFIEIGRIPDNWELESVV